MNGNNTYLKHLKKLPLFAGLSDSDLGFLAKSSHIQDCERNTVVFLKGDRATGLYAVLDGTIRIACMSSDGDEKVIDLLGPGRIFGEGALFHDNTAQPFLAAALTRAKLLHVDAASLLAVVHASPRLSLRMLRRLAEWNTILLRSIKSISMRTAQERVVDFLLAQHAESTTNATPSQAFDFPAPKHVCASMLGITPEAFSRTVRDLIDAGLIAVRRHQVDILDWQRLAALYPECPVAGTVA